jgi:acyl-CoA hydrolase
MVVEVTGAKRDVMVRKWVRTLNCLVTFVNIDEQRKPAQVPLLEAACAPKLDAWAKRRKALTQQWNQINEQVELSAAAGTLSVPLVDPHNTPREMLGMKATTLKLRRMFMPHHLNPGGTVFGGDVLEWMETGALATAVNFTCNEHMTTISLDRLNFVKPIYAGDFVELTAQVVYVTTHTVHVDTVVHIANSSGKVHTHTGHFVVLNLDAIGTKRPVTAGLKCESDEECLVYEKAKRRHQFWQEHEQRSSSVPVRENLQYE